MLLRTLSLVSILVFTATACQSGSSSSTSTTSQAAPSATTTQAGLTRVDPTLVCMVNDQFMGKAQIPVQVDGKTYFGCCPMCKGRLEQDPTVRAAKDPTTGEAVDKATAVIAQDPTGRVHYFASEKNLHAYRPTP